MTEKGAIKAGMPVVLVTGDDEVLREQATLRVVEVLLDGMERTLALEEISWSQMSTEREPELAPLVDAAQTAPFLTDRRVVVGRHLGAFEKKERLEPLLDYLRSPLPTTSLVLVWEKPPGSRPGSRLPPSLSKAVAAAGGTRVDASSPKGKEQQAFVERALRESDLKLDRASVRMLIDRIGSDLGRLEGVIAVLQATYGASARLHAEDVAPYLGEAADVAPWDLTDAIDSGDAARSIEVLHRMIGAGERHALVVMAVLQRHYEQMLRLDGADVRDDREAAQALGITATFPAKKALAGCRRLGSKRLRRAIEYLADADLDLRGRSALPDPLVLEVLAARLARLSRERGA